MKHIKNIILGFCVLGCSTAAAQETETVHVDDPWKDYPTKKELYDNYSHWSIGINAGQPYFAGDFWSVGRGNKFLQGPLVGLQVGYQFNPIFGLKMSFDYGFNKAGSQSHEDSFLLMPDGSTYYNVDIPEGSERYRDLYSNISMMNAGLHWETDLLNLFRRSDGNRRWALIAAPGIYLQYFNSTVKRKSDDSKFSEGVGKKIDFGAGGDIALRYRLNKNIDIQAKGGMIWINNDKFDGINSINTTKHNTVITAQVGLVWKIGNGNGKKKDNIVYAPGYLPMWKRATKTVTITKIVRDTIYIEKEITDKSKEVVVCQGVPDLPAVYFERGKWKLDTDKYARELFTIAKTLKENPDLVIDIYGYADHTGGEEINKKITEKRAEALKKWLVKVGIEKERLNTYGLGKDMTIERELRFTEKARRSEIREKK